MHAISLAVFCILVSLIPCSDFKQSKQSRNKKGWAIRKKGSISFNAPLHRNIIKIKAVKSGSPKRLHIIKCCGRRKCSQFNKSKNKKRNNSTNIDGWRNTYNAPSYKTVRIGSKKYKFPNEMATYEDAKKICEREHMALTSFDNPDEVSQISDYLQYIGLSDDPVFASISLAGGGASAFSNWGTGSPPGGPGKCLIQQEGQFYNGSCNTKTYFACEDPKKEDPSTLGLDSLSSIADAVLNFVGGKNLIVPSDQATVPEAKTICKDQGLELMSLNSITQLDSVQDFLGDIGLSSSTLLTSMSKVTDGGSDWLGELASALIPPKDPSTDGDCLGLNSLGLVGITCDMVSNFVCQVPDPPGGATSSPKTVVGKTTTGKTKSDAPPTENSSDELSSTGSDAEVTEISTEGGTTSQTEQDTSESTAILTSTVSITLESRTSITPPRAAPTTLSYNSLQNTTASIFGTSNTQTQPGNSTSVSTSSTLQPTTLLAINTTRSEIQNSSYSTTTSAAAMNATTTSTTSSTNTSTTLTTTTPTPITTTSTSTTTSPSTTTSTTTLTTSTTTSTTSTTTTTTTSSTTTTTSTTTTSTTLPPVSDHVMIVGTLPEIRYLISGVPVSNHLAEEWCRSKGFSFLSIKTALQFQELTSKLRTNSSSIPQHSDLVLGIGLRLVNNMDWQWSNQNLAYTPSQVGWLIPNYANDVHVASTGDCAGIYLGNYTTITFPCTESKRILCN